jgi:hypothetical protein
MKQKTLRGCEISIRRIKEKIKQVERLRGHGEIGTYWGDLKAVDKYLGELKEELHNLEATQQGLTHQQNPDKIK